MPTYTTADRFWRDWAKLSPENQARFRVAVDHFIEDLRAGNGFRPGLRVKRVEGTRDVFEMTWAPDGRATWEYGEPRLSGEAHIVWRRIGTHDIFDRP